MTYLERNKVLKIPESNKTGDVEFLEKEFRKEFKFHSNVSLNVTFQCFDSDWGEYVDLDEDCTLVHKDKLKAVVSPLLTTPSTDSCEVIMGVVPACAQSFKCKVVLYLFLHGRRLHDMFIVYPEE